VFRPSPVLRQGVLSWRNVQRLRIVANPADFWRKNQLNRLINAFHGVTVIPTLLVTLSAKNLFVDYETLNGFGSRWARR
jgi:hypothetical protein